tara:strand:+ start:926 stop:1459 length:534 start_codon:yes stop_codon:yes gene_type:complete
MNRHQLRSLIKKTIVGKLQRQGINKYKEYKVLNHVPDLISILTDLLSPQFNLFVRDIEWVAPKPPTFRVVLENDQKFYLIDYGRSWMAEVEGKQYYLLNLGEEEMAMSAIARILRYGKPINADMGEELGGGRSASGGGSTGGGGGGGGSMEAALNEPLPGEEGGAEEVNAEEPELEL